MSIDMVALAGRNLRSYLSKASFGSSVDRQAAINCIEVLEEAITAKPLDETHDPLVKVAHSLDTGPLDKAVAVSAVGDKGAMTDAEIDAIANDGYRNAAGGIYATSVLDFARALLAAQPADPSTEYKRGLREAFDCANKIKHNRQGRTAEETCAYIVRRLSEYANGFSSVLEENEGRDAPDSRSLGVIAAQPAQAMGFSIRHVDGRWRTLDSTRMPDWTNEQAQALCFSLREHADRYAEDDPEDVRIIPVGVIAPATLWMLDDACGFTVNPVLAAWWREDPRNVITAFAEVKS